MKISIKNVPVLQESLDEIQGKCTARTVTAQEIVCHLEKAEKRIGIPKKYLTGTKVTYTAAQSFPGAYKHTPYSTHFTAIHNGKCWEITDIRRDICPNRVNNAGILLSEVSKEKVVQGFGNVRI